MVCGLGGHGKDTFCEILEDKFNLTFESSSRASAPIVFDKIGEKYGYSDHITCWADRRNHREEWFEIIAAMNQEYPTTAKMLFDNYDVYCGCRSLKEFLMAKDHKLFQLSIWVDAGKRLPDVKDPSCQIRKEDCDVVVDNNGTIDDLYDTVERIYNIYVRSSVAQSS